MACFNASSSSLIFLNDLPSFGLIGLVSISLILYFAYIILFIRNQPSSSVYIYFSQLSLFFLLISPITFLIRPSASINIVCSIQTLSIQILPFCFLLGFNVHFAYECLSKFTNSNRKSSLILISTFLLFFLAILIQTAILLIWFYHNHNSEPMLELCTNQCRRPFFLCSLIFHFLLLFLYSFQSSIKYHYHSQQTHFIYLLTSLLALGVTMIWICLYLFRPLKSSYAFYIDNNYILAYGTIFFVYSFLGPFLYEQVFYRKENSVQSNNINRMTFNCLSLTKEQQRAFMAAYIKRNLTASCENLTTKNNLSLADQTRHSTLSVESLCPTLVSTISYGTSLGNATETLTSEYLLMSTSTERK